MSGHRSVVNGFVLTVLLLIFSFIQFPTLASEHKLSLARIDRYELWPKRSRDWDLERVNMSLDWEITTWMVLAGLHLHKDDVLAIEHSEAYCAQQASMFEARAKSGDILSEIKDKVPSLHRLRLDKIVDVIVDKEGILYLRKGTPLTDLTAQTKPLLDTSSSEPPDLTLLGRTKPARSPLKIGFANLPLIKFMIYRPSAESIFRQPPCFPVPHKQEGSPAEFPRTYEFLRSLRTSERHWPEVYEWMSRSHKEYPAEIRDAWATWAHKGMDEEKEIRDVIARIGSKKRLDVVLDTTEIYAGQDIVRKNGKDITDDVIAELQRHD